MTLVNVTEFRNNLKKYADLAQKEDLKIVNHDKTLFYAKGPKSRKQEALENLCGCLDSQEDYKETLKNRIKDYEDALMDATSFNNGIDYIVTRNISDFENSLVRAIEPKNFIKLFM